MKVHTNCLFSPQITRIIFLLILCFETRIIADYRGLSRIVFFYHRLRGLFFFNLSKSNVILSKAKNLVYVGLCFRDPSPRSLR